jgi:hypothetical protein
MNFIFISAAESMNQKTSDPGGQLALLDLRFLQFGLIDKSHPRSRFSKRSQVLFCEIALRNALPPFLF